ncbi:glycoside hydrolase family 32 protein [Salipaludibacillus agaradhaerens]|uniref:glycoside hydrolase family 32 protein n=1 Tax=Salipaludibacillus agaradhaerens TaxID=76935 RepID=UPI0023EA6FA4|nr:sucrose-6-phosphate hydrolase [Salipaludibacillus agaradhaerens]
MEGDVSIVMTDNEKKLHEQAYEEVEKKRHIDKIDPYRQIFHVMPPTGLLNDPNGWIKWKGTYHLFYQWYPYDTTHGSKYWGHYSSKDLVTWKEEPIALAPSEWYEKNGCYSGSAVDNNGVLTLIYTGNVKDEEDRRDSYQCVATSTDGTHFTKLGPVIESLPDGYTAHFRDPKVWKQGELWYMVLGAQTVEEKGRVVLYTSKNLTDWEFKGAIAGAGIGGITDFGYMWECPDLFSLDSKDVLIISPQGLEQEGIHYQNKFQAGYFIGEVNLDNAIFHHGDFAELDHGFEFYAPQTTVDENGRRLLTAWMGVPEQDEETQPTVTNGWLHCLTIPRELHIHEGRLWQTPVKELQKLRHDQESITQTLSASDLLTFGDLAETAMEFVLTGLEEIKGIFEWTFRNEARLIFNAASHMLTLERRNTRTHLTEQRHVRIDSLKRLHVFMDASSLEIFINGGEAVMSARYFPSPKDKSLTMRADEQVMISLDKWVLS